jgi:hypothetical protein
LKAAGATAEEYQSLLDAGAIAEAATDKCVWAPVRREV